ncbi:MAG: pilus assembly PilX N-terminal domain-containing protein [Gammaproteobacteria bacterium]|nr:pilus assembly PilX N-terminal domain-containing protein [Gammaproteobacteria bacterium]
MNIAAFKSQPPPSRQDGIVLVVGLVFLLVLTIIGVTSLRTTTLEQRMAGNMQQRTVAFQDAETRIAMMIGNINSGSVVLSPGDDCSGASPHDTPGAINDAIAYHLSCREFIGSTEQPRRTDTAFGGQTSLFHFRIRSESQTAGNAEVNIQQGGVYEGGSEGQGVLRE